MPAGLPMEGSTERTVQWQADFRNNQVDIVSRRDIVKACLELVTQRPIAILPEPNRKVARFPELSYGVKREILVLTDGKEFESFISWNQVIWFACGFEEDMAKGIFSGSI